MSILANRVPSPSKPKKQRYFEITFSIEQDRYAVSLLACDPSIARKAFRLRKLTALDEPVSYDVRITQYGAECECQGYLRWNHCKHGEVIQAASQIFNLNGGAA